MFEEMPVASFFAQLGHLLWKTASVHARSWFLGCRRKDRGSSNFRGRILVNFANGIAPLAKLDVLQFLLVYACVLPRMAALSEETGYTPTQETLSDGGRGPHSQGFKGDQRRSKGHLRYSCRMVASSSETRTHFQHR